MVEKTSARVPTVTKSAPRRLRCVEGCYMNGVGLWAVGDEISENHIPAGAIDELIRQGKFVIVQTDIEDELTVHRYNIDQGEG